MIWENEELVLEMLHKVDAWVSHIWPVIIVVTFQCVNLQIASPMSSAHFLFNCMDFVRLYTTIIPSWKLETYGARKYCYGNWSDIFQSSYMGKRTLHHKIGEIGKSLIESDTFRSTHNVMECVHVLMWADLWNETWNSLPYQLFWGTVPQNHCIV